MPDHTETSTQSPSQPKHEPGKDEFGRDLRRASEDRDDGVKPDPDKQPSQDIVASFSPPPEPSKQDEKEKSESPSDMDSESVQDETVAEPAAKPNGPQGQGSTLANKGGLETFDITTFNPTDPGSWKALGDAFEVTNGRTPSQEELMQLIMGGMMGVMGSGGMGQWGGQTQSDGVGDYQSGQGQRGGSLRGVDRHARAGGLGLAAERPGKVIGLEGLVVGGAGGQLEGELHGVAGAVCPQLRNGPGQLQRGRPGRAGAGTAGQQGRQSAKKDAG